MKTKLKQCKECKKDRPIWKREGTLLYCKTCWFKITSSNITKPIVKKQKAIPKESSKRKKEHILYSLMRVQFLKDYPICGMNITNICTNKAQEIQHLKGRGKYYLDLRFWLQSCSICHRYATDHPTEAIDNGWALPKLTE